VSPRADPTFLVEAAFERIRRERMAGLPFLNPALAVEMVDPQRWHGQWLGVLVTPWGMSVLLLPGEPTAWQPVAPQQRRFVRFPYGELAFLGGDEPGLGEYQACSLFATMERFTTQAQARATARAALRGLLAPPAPASEGARSAPTDRPPAPAPSRRAFLGLRA